MTRPALSPTLGLCALLALGLTACTPPSTPSGGNGGQTLASITLTCAASSVQVGATTTCTAQGRTAGGAALSTQPTFTYASSDPAKASVTATGIVTGVAAGSAALTASAAGITSNTVTLSVSSSPTPAPAGATILYKGSNTAFTTPGFTAAIRSDGMVAFTALEGGNTNVYVYQDTSKKVYTVPATTPLNAVSGKMCIDKAGNVALPTRDQGTYLDVTTGTVSLMPFPKVDGDPIVHFECPADGRVIGSETDFTGTDDDEYAFAWTPGQSGVTAFEKVFNGCSGCNVRDANAAGDVLFYNAIIRGGVITYFPKTPVDALTFRAGDLGEAGTVWGTSVTTTASPTFLAKWTPGGVEQVLALPSGDGPTTWDVREANNSGEVLLLRQVENNKYEGGLDRSYFVYRAGALLPVTAPDGYKPALLALDLDDQGRVLVQLSGVSSVFDNAWALIRP